MNISANIIRFPAPALSVESRVEKPAEADNVVKFETPADLPAFDPESQEHGQIFVAHRMLARVAGQLDAMATL